MKPRIAIPLPHGADHEYALRAIPQYERAVELSGGEPVRIPLDRTPAEVMKMIEHCDAVLLPGSKADVDPAKFDAPRHPKTEAADALRDTVDELLLQDAYNMRKPVLGICYGLQILNVYRSGNLLQHIESSVNHEAGRKVPIAHAVAIEPNSKLGRIISSAPQTLWGQPPSAVRPGEAGQFKSRAVTHSWGQPPSAVRPGEAGQFESRAGTHEEVGVIKTGKGTAYSRADSGTNKKGALAPQDQLIIRVNSSHHQAAGDIIGDGLRITARCPDDSIIEAIEGTASDHFVLAVQWHPERSFDEDPHSRAIFSLLVDAARQRHHELIGEFETSG